MSDATTRSSRRRLHVGIVSRALPGEIGGIAQATMGLVHALGKLEDGDEQYSIIVRAPEQAEWLAPHCGPNQRVVVHRHLGDRAGAAASLRVLLASDTRDVRRRLRERRIAHLERPDPGGR